GRGPRPPPGPRTPRRRAVFCPSFPRRRPLRSKATPGTSAKSTVAGSAFAHRSGAGSGMPHVPGV
ncbi:MAG: hypothetical protein AVDCRST_MAG02-949, partial [uncultured Rubrobacteraceae bacterium]